MSILKKVLLILGYGWGMAALGALATGLLMPGTQNIIMPQLEVPAEPSVYRTIIPYKYQQGSAKGPISPIIRIQMDDRMCSATVIDAHFAVTAAHCVHDENQRGISGSEVQIFDKDGIERGKARAGGMLTDVDVAILVGDFKEFHGYDLSDNDTLFTEGHAFYTCGYPYGQKKLICNTFIPKDATDFEVVGTAVVRSGMSGGPIMDLSTGDIVGVNMGVNERGALITPTLGILGAFGIEP